MSLKHLRKSAVATILATMTVTNLGAPLMVNAQDLFDEAPYGFTEETSTSLKTNCYQVKQFGNFKTVDSITIPGSEYKNLIETKISKIEVKEVKNGSESPYVSLTGLDGLNGKVIYNITSSLPISTDGLSPVDMVDYYGNAVRINKNESGWIDPTSGHKAKGISIVFDVDWGKLVSLNNLPYLQEFESTSMPDLKIDIEIKNLRLSDKQELNKEFTLTASVGKYTVSTKTGTPLKIQYSKYTDPDKFGESVKKYYAGETNFSEDVTPSFPNSYASIRVGERTLFNNTNSGSSQMRPNKPSIDNSDSDRMIVLRLYNPATGEHLFTTNAAERVQLVSIGWKNEFCEWDTPAKSDTPIYRLCNPNNDDHHYTTNPTEKDMLVQLGWRYEGSPFYSAEKGEGLSVYRLYNPNATGVGSHHYTSSKEERGALVSYGWKDEGIAWCGLLKED